MNFPLTGLIAGFEGKNQFCLYDGRWYHDGPNTSWSYHL